VVAGIEIAMTRDAYLLLASTALPMALCHVAYAAWFRKVAPSTPATA